MEYRKTGRCLYHVHRPAVFLRTAAHRQKDKSKGSHIGKIWTTLFVPGMLRRKAFLAGLFLAVAFWLISSLFVWDIQVTGNYQVTDDVFYSFLEQEGIHTGMRRSELNIGELENR